jgi:hypothetical protein
MKFNSATRMCEDPCRVYIKDCQCTTEICVNFTIPNNCDLYHTNCTDKLTRCPDKLKFNPATRKCEDPCQVYIKDCQFTTKISVNFTIPNNCDFYCNNCTDKLIRCPDKLKFNPATRKCEDPCRVYIKDCISTTEICVNFTVSNNCDFYRNNCTDKLIRWPDKLKFNTATRKCENPRRVYIKDCPCECLHKQVLCVHATPNGLSAILQWLQSDVVPVSGESSLQWSHTVLWSPMQSWL